MAERGEVVLRGSETRDEVSVYKFSRGNDVISVMAGPQEDGNYGLSVQVFGYDSAGAIDPDRSGNATLSTPKEMSPERRITAAAALAGIAHYVVS